MSLTNVISGISQTPQFANIPTSSSPAVVEAEHQLLFDLHSRIGLNLGVLFAWVAINTALFPFACYLMRWKGEREHRLKEEKQKQWLTAMSRQRTNLGIPKKSK